VGDFGLDPEVALKIILMLLRWAAYLFAGFAVVGLCTYIVFLCRQVFSAKSGAGAKTSEIKQPPACPSAAEPIHNLATPEAPILVQEATVTPDRSKLAVRSDSPVKAPLR
jgi:hypothetical protein